ncbi:MAG: hypothetical protein ACI4J0_00125 [Huintestinicola sp.]|uniref:hypothetical protein n=1 Tax=Huintestinicola sp. TaxID=2981661 RepID=UPI003F02DC50
MNTIPFYELRTRLYASAASGCGAVNEDFRLRRAIEAFEPLAQANKAFMKLYSDCAKLFTSDHPADVLSDCIALADALAVTQGSFGDSSETQPSEINAEMKIIPVTYSALSELCEKIEKCSPKLQELTESEIRLVSDGRVLSAFIRATENGNVYLDSFAENVINIYGEAMVPMLRNTVDLTDEKASGKTVDYIYMAAGAKENDYYISLAKNPEAPQNIRISAIKAMSHDTANSDILLELYNTEKGKVKNAALMAVLELDPPEAEEILSKLIEKSNGNYDKYADHVRISPSQTAEELVRAKMNETAQVPCDKDILLSALSIERTVSLFKNKSGIADCYLEAVDIIKKWGAGEQLTENYYASLNDTLIKNLQNKDNDKFRCLISELYKKSPNEFVPAYFFMKLIYDPDDAVSVLSGSLEKLHYTVTSLLADIRYSSAHKAYFTEYRCGPAENGSEPAGKAFLFESFPDSLLGVMCSLSDINEKFYEHICSSLLGFIEGCAPYDRERIVSAVLDAAFDMANKCPSYYCVDLIAKYCPESMADRCRGIASEYIYSTLITKRASTSCSIINRLPLSYSDKIDELTELLNRVAAAKGNFNENTRNDLMKNIKSWIEFIMKG